MSTFLFQKKKMHGVPPLNHKSEHKKGQKKKKQPKTNQKHTRRAQTRATSLFKGPKGPSQPKNPREKKPTKIYYKFIYIIKLKKYLEVSQFLLLRGLVKKY